MAALGALFFDGLSLAVMLGAEKWGHGTAGEPGPDLFLTLGFLVFAPATYVASLAGVGPADINSPLNSTAFGFTVNGLLGALLFGGLGFFWLILGTNE